MCAVTFVMAHVSVRKKYMHEKTLDKFIKWKLIEKNGSFYVSLIFE